MKEAVIINLALRLAIRALLVALLLLTGAVDFACFDLTDPYAPMNEAGASMLPSPVQRAGFHQGPASAQAARLLDDGCLGCGIGFAVSSGVAAPVLPASAVTAGYPRREPLPRGTTPRLPPKA